MKNSEYVMPELQGATTGLPYFDDQVSAYQNNIVLTRETFIHLIHTIRNQRFIETKPVNEQKKRQAIIDKTYDWMLGLISINKLEDESH